MNHSSKETNAQPSKTTAPYEEGASELRKLLDYAWDGREQSSMLDNHIIESTRKLRHLMCELQCLQSTSEVGMRGIRSCAGELALELAAALDCVRYLQESYDKVRTIVDRDDEQQMDEMLGRGVGESQAACH